MCHETTGQIGVKFAPELFMAGLSVTPAHMERQDRYVAHSLKTQSAEADQSRSRDWGVCVVVGRLRVDAL